MTYDRIEYTQEFIGKAPARLGDLVWAWDDDIDKREIGILLGIDPSRPYRDHGLPCRDYGLPYLVLVGEDSSPNWWANISTDSDLHAQHLTHKEISELVEPVEASHWRSLDIKEVSP